MKKFLKYFNIVLVLASAFLFYAEKSVANNNDYLIFIATNSGNGYHGNLITVNDPNATAESISNIDSLCNTSKSKPTDPSGFDRKYKAMIGSKVRQPMSEVSLVSKDWVMQPDTKYYIFQSGKSTTSIKTTNINQTFLFPIEHQLSSEDYKVWTGLNADWTIADNHCGNWTSKNGDDNGRFALANTTDSRVISKEGKHCDGHGYLYCVMQPTIMMLNPIPGGESQSNTKISIQFNNLSGVGQGSVSTASFTVTAENKATPINGIITNISESIYEFTPNEDLTPNTKYIAAVIGVKDKNNKLIPDAKFTFTATQKDLDTRNIIFVTSKNWKGNNLGPVKDVDQKCQEEADTMSVDHESSIYKAMIIYDNETRNIYNDWVLEPNTTYFNLESKSIGTTNESGIFTTNLKDYIYGKDKLLYKRIWTGMSENWNRKDDNDKSCHSWGSTDYIIADAKGIYGASNTLNIDDVISKNDDYCRQDHDLDRSGSDAHLYCVRRQK